MVETFLEQTPKTNTWYNILHKKSKNVISSNDDGERQTPTFQRNPNNKNTKKLTNFPTIFLSSNDKRGCGTRGKTQNTLVSTEKKVKLSLVSHHEQQHSLTDHTQRIRCRKRAVFFLSQVVLVMPTLLYRKPDQNTYTKGKTGEGEQPIDRSISPDKRTHTHTHKITHVDRGKRLQ